MVLFLYLTNLILPVFNYQKISVFVVNTVHKDRKSNDRIFCYITIINFIIFTPITQYFGHSAQSIHQKFNNKYIQNRNFQNHCYQGY